MSTTTNMIPSMAMGLGTIMSTAIVVLMGITTTTMIRLW